MEQHCSPKAFETGRTSKSCFSMNELKLLVREFNKNHPVSEQIKGKTKQELIQGLLKSYKTVCNDNQYCLIRHVLTDADNINSLEKAFRPQKPASWKHNPSAWLTNYDIFYVMKQYEELYTDFAFLTVAPIDFADRNSSGKCIGDMLCDFDIKYNIFEKKKLRFGIVVNTDTSQGSGEHWQAIYCSLNTKKPNYGIYFYDSVASVPSQEVQKFMKLVVTQVNDPKFESKYNRVQRQFGNNECGMFSIVFLTQCLKNIPFNEICHRMHRDNKINSFRNVLFR